jgi:hypothetical protein
MVIQKRLLLEQIELLKNCELGRKVMRGAMPETVEEFREQVSLTTYADYLPELAEKREDVLPAKPVAWARTSGRSGEYGCKWVPFSQAASEEFVKVGASVMLFASCRDRGDISQFREHLKYLFTLPPQPFLPGVMGYYAQQALGFDYLPSNADGMSFRERIQAGFEEALYQGLDGFGGLSITLVAMGEEFKRQSGKANIGSLLSHPNALFRVTKGLMKSKLARRPMLPKDIWSVKWIMGGGTDSTIYKEKVKELWGRGILEVYGSAEGLIFALQTWDYEGMTFIPNLNFFEFIPEREYFKWQLDHSYQPKTVLLDEVKAGENYEIVITNFRGGAFVRYRIGDVVRITSLRNEKLNIAIPQMVFHSRIDELIDIISLGRLTEKAIWQAIENTGIPYVDWSARKETIGDEAVLHLYIELKGNYIASENGVAAAVYEQIQKLDDYKTNLSKIYGGSPESILGLKPIKVTFLPQGAFSNYISQRQAEGADLGHLKPPHINPSDKVLSLLGAAPVEVEAVPAAEAERAAAR